MIQVTLPASSGSTSAINFALNAPAIGASFPLTVDAGTILSGTVASARLPAGQYPGSTAGTAIGAGYVGELKEATGSAGSFTTITTVASLTLTDGTWLINGDMFFNGNASASDTSANWMLKGVDDSTTAKGKIYSGSPAGLRAAIKLPSRVIQIASSDADKTIKIRATTTNSQTADGYLSAVRIA